MMWSWEIVCRKEKCTQSNQIERLSKRLTSKAIGIIPSRDSWRDKRRSRRAWIMWLVLVEKRELIQIRVDKFWHFNLVEDILKNIVSCFTVLQILLTSATKIFSNLAIWFDAVAILDLNNLVHPSKKTMPKVFAQWLSFFKILPNL